MTPARRRTTSPPRYAGAAVTVRPDLLQALRISWVPRHPAHRWSFGWTGSDWWTVVQTVSKGGDGGGARDGAYCGDRPPDPCASSRTTVADSCRGSVRILASADGSPTQDPTDATARAPAGSRPGFLPARGLPAGTSPALRKVVPQD